MEITIIYNNGEDSTFTDIIRDSVKSFDGNLKFHVREEDRSITQEIIPYNNVHRISITDW